MTPAEKLKRLGLTPEQVRQHVVSVAPPVSKNYYALERSREFRQRQKLNRRDAETQRQAA